MLEFFALSLMFIESKLLSIAIATDADFGLTMFVPIGVLMAIYSTSSISSVLVSSLFP